MKTRDSFRPCTKKPLDCLARFILKKVEVSLRVCHCVSQSGRIYLCAQNPLASVFTRREEEYLKLEFGANLRLSQIKMWTDYKRNGVISAKSLHVRKLTISKYHACSHNEIHCDECLVVDNYCRTSAC
jgi:hypothetical protein